jgi:hypothetical protein
MRSRIIKAWQVLYEWLGKKEGKTLDDDKFLRAFWIMHFPHDKDLNADFDNYESDLFDNKFPIKI